MIRSPLTSFAGERLPGIGHNQGPPLEAGHGLRVHAWKKARAELMPKLPLEVLKRRVARAKALGLEYPQYASILLGTGRDVVAFLFTSDAIGLRVERGARIPETIAAKLNHLLPSERLLMTPKQEFERFQKLLGSGLPVLFDGYGPSPERMGCSSEARSAIRAILDPRRLPGDAVVMIGTDPQQRDWADAARLAKFIPSEAYFR